MTHNEKLEKLQEKLKPLGWTFEDVTGVYLNVFHYAKKEGKRITLGYIENSLSGKIHSWETVQEQIKKINQTEEF